MKFKVDTVEYDFPDVDSLTMDETILLEKYAGQTVEQFLPGDGLPMGAVKGLIVIGILRAQPNSSEREVAAAIGKIKLADLGGIVEQEPEDDARPPASTGNEPSDSTRISGGNGNDGSEPSPEVLALRGSGLPGSDTGATSDQKTSAA